jgi:hypothetical protein
MTEQGEGMTEYSKIKSAFILECLNDYQIIAEIDLLSVKSSFALQEKFLSISNLLML